MASFREQQALEFTPVPDAVVTRMEVTPTPTGTELTAPELEPADRAVDAAEHPDATTPTARNPSVHNRFMSRPKYGLPGTEVPQSDT